MTLTIKQLSFIAVACLILGALWDYLFYGKMPGISVFVYVSLLLIGFFVFVNYFQISFYQPVKTALNLLAVPILFFSLMVGVRDSHFLTTFNILASFGLLLIFAGQATGRSIKNYLVIDFFETALLSPFKFLAAGLAALGKLFSVNRHLKDNQTAFQVIKGVIITTPILLFFLFLFSRADLVFGKIVSELFDWQVNLENISRVWRMLVIAFIWLGTYVYIFQRSSPAPVPRALKESLYKFGRIEAAILFGALNLLFLLFVVIQIKYLFAGHSGIADLGFTYAEYAHKGFGELIVVALLSFGLIFGADKYIEKKGNGHFVWFQVLSGVMIAMLLVIMASAFIRLTLYEQAYGFTALRLLVQNFIVWLALIFLVQYIKVLKFLPESFFAFWSLMLVIAFFVIIIYLGNHVVHRYVRHTFVGLGGKTFALQLRVFFH